MNTGDDDERDLVDDLNLAEKYWGTSQDGCEHDVVPYGDGNWGRCTKCGDDTFPIRLEWDDDLKETLHGILGCWVMSIGARATREQKDLVINEIHRAVWDHEYENNED